MKIIRLLSIFIVLMAFCSSVSMACMCPAQSMETAFQNADSVFVGKAISVKKTPTTFAKYYAPIPEGAIDFEMLEVSITFLITDSFKAAEIGKTVTVSATENIACGIRGWSSTRKGHKWVVFADTTTAGGLITDHCTNTSLATKTALEAVAKAKN